MLAAGDLLGTVASSRSGSEFFPCTIRNATAATLLAWLEIDTGHRIAGGIGGGTYRHLLQGAPAELTKAGPPP